jgi:membrane fusion protein (multidrug efflux system)
MKNLRAARGVALTITTLLLGGCGAPGQSNKTDAVPEVGVMIVQPQRVTITTLLPGRTVAYRIAQVRPQVSGIIKQRLFTEGALVKAGQPLYQLDPAPYQAAYDSAQAAVTKAGANLLTVQLKYERYLKLAATGDVSQQDRDDVTASLSQAQADEKTARAQLEGARINLAYTRIVAPIEGRIATSVYTEGALVTANQDAPLTTVQQYQPMYVDMTQPASAVMRLRSQLASGKLKNADTNSASVRLLMDDGSYYPLEGRLQFTGVTVSEGTGAITLRAVFPNPDGVLLPGMYVRAQLAEAIDEQALLLPQQAVSRDARGEATTLVVGPDDKVELRSLNVEPASDHWRVIAGLHAGERVIVQGQVKAKVDAPVKPTIVKLDTPARG